MRTIRESLAAHGQYRPVVVNEPTMEVPAGNHTLYAARELGWTELSATFVHVDDDQARRIVLVDNRTSDLMGYDDSLETLLKRSVRLRGRRVGAGRGAVCGPSGRCAVGHLRYGVPRM